VLCVGLLTCGAWGVCLHPAATVFVQPQWHCLVLCWFCKQLQVLRCWSNLCLAVWEAKPLAAQVPSEHTACVVFVAACLDALCLGHGGTRCFVRVGARRHTHHVCSHGAQTAGSWPLAVFHWAAAGVCGRPQLREEQLVVVHDA
jgi:hypothetical protein